MAEALGEPVANALRRYALHVKPWTDRIEALVADHPEMFAPLDAKPMLGRAWAILDEAIREMEMAASIDPTDS